MTDTKINYEVADGVATLTLNRPEVLNAFNDDMAREVLDALKAAERDAAVRCLVLMGAGKGFCAGQDLGALRAREQAVSFREHLQQTFNPIIARLRALEKPVIGQINGAAAGAGLGPGAGLRPALRGRGREVPHGL